MDKGTQDENRSNPLQPLQGLNMTAAEEERILRNLRSIMTAEERTKVPPFSKQADKHRRAHRFAIWQTTLAGAAAVVLVGGALWGISQNHGRTPVANGGNLKGGMGGETSNTSSASLANGSKSQGTPPTLHAFHEATNWIQPDSSPYNSGLSTVPVPSAPSAFEQSIRPTDTKTVAEILVSKGYGDVTSPSSWTQQIQFTGTELQINGQTYTVPPQYAHEQLFVLPVDGGIVWAPIGKIPDDRMQPRKDLQGESPIFYTPYAATGGLLSTHMTTIATVPHNWLGPDGPVIASAWTGWLPQSQVAMPKVVSESANDLNFDKSDNISSVQTVTALPDWPTFFLQNLAKASYYKNAHYAAYIQSLTRTKGGFVMNLGFMDATKSGRNAGMTGAAYYWSEQTGKWTPLNQTYTVQTIPAWTDTGSDGVYWIQNSPISGPGNPLAVAEMYFNPATLKTTPIWMGDWFYGESVVDGNSWAVVLSSDEPSTAGEQVKQWTVYTPDALFDTSLTLPAGQTIVTNQTIRWKNLDVSLQVQKPQGGYAGILGNHSQVLSHQTVATSAGTADLVLNERTQPAASTSQTPTYEYWVIVNGKQYAYAIEATVIGDKSQAEAARGDVMELLHHWQVPKS